MNNDEQERNPNEESQASDYDQSDDDLRYAPPTASLDADDAPSEPVEEIDDSAADLDTEVLVEVEADDDSAYAPIIEEVSVEVTTGSLPVNVTDGLDIEAALAAVSTLSDVIAEQEAAEQARIARIEAEAEAKAERQARIENPERFFSVPPLTSLKRGQLASIVPALWLIGLGAWLTFTLTTTHTAPDTSLVVLVIVLGLGLTLLARWVASHRWARGSLFFGLISLFWGGLFFYTSQPNAYGFPNMWPLFIAAVGLAMLITRALSPSSQSFLLLPSLILIIAGLIGAVVTMGLLPTNITVAAASLWPVALVIIVIIWLFPLLFRQRQ